MIKTTIDANFDYKKAVRKGSMVGIIGCSDCASVYQTGDSKTIEKIRDSLSGHCDIVFTASMDSPCDQRLLRYVSKAADGFEKPEYYILLTCVAGAQSITSYLSLIRPRESFKVVSPVATEEFSIISTDGASHTACVFCRECVFDDRSVFCPIANCPVNKKDGPCQNRESNNCVVDKGKVCSWIY